MTPPIGSARAGLVSQVGDALPDSVDSHWPSDEGVNSVLNDSIGTRDIDLSSFNGWVSGSQYNGDTAPSFDMTDGDYAQTQSNGDFNNAQLTYTVWLENVDIDSNNTFPRIATNGSVSGQPPAGWAFVFNDEATNQVDVYQYSASTGNFAAGTTIEDAATNHIMLAMVLNGDTSTIYQYDANGDLQNQDTATANRDTGGTYPLTLMRGNTDGITATQDDPTIAIGDALSEPSVSDIANNTGPNA